MMKSIVIFYDQINSKYKNEKVFGGKSSVELSKQWAQNLGIQEFTVSGCNTITQLLEKMNEISLKEKADFVLFSFNDLPFLNDSLTKELINAHVEYKSEYTFADGYPYGFTPEVIDCGALKILLELSKTNYESEGKKLITRNGIYSFLKNDINSFEVETVLAQNDWRLFRFNFDCSNKLNFLSCKALDKIIIDNPKLKENVDELCKVASKDKNVLKTVPAFYNIQIADKCSGKCSYCPYPKEYKSVQKINVENSDKLMSFDNFSKLVEEISSFSENAVISLSLWGESFNHPDILKFIEKVLSYKDLSLFIETDGLLINQDFCSKLNKLLSDAEERNSQWPKIMFAISLDAFTSDVYKKIRGTEKSLEDAIKSVQMLVQSIGPYVYPQFVRMNENENELEKFFRFWKEKSNITQGNFIIQKYDDFANLLNECKPTDLSPVDRNICWHLRRDITILSNGDVTLCKEYVLNNVQGNIFTDGIETVWKKMDKCLEEQIEQKYIDKCGSCDEYYTFNF